jgi:hypothetical protein
MSSVAAHRGYPPALPFLMRSGASDHLGAVEVDCASATEGWGVLDEDDLFVVAHAWQDSSGLISRRAICCWLVDRWVELVLCSQPEDEPEASVTESPRAVNSPQAFERKSAAS